MKHSAMPAALELSALTPFLAKSAPFKITFSVPILCGHKRALSSKGRRHGRMLHKSAFILTISLFFPDRGLSVLCLFRPKSSTYP